jgi:hypothetical protein
MQSDDSSSLREIVAYVTRHMVCHECGGAYGLDEVRPVFHDAGEWALVAACAGCGTKRTITAYDSPPYIHLNKTRVVPAEITDAVVSDWSLFLASFSGDIYDLLAQA